MGNKQSSAKGGTDGVKKRNKKGTKKGERPVSSPQFNEEGPTMGQIGGAPMRRAGSVDISNMQQNAEVVFHTDHVVGTSALAGESVFNLYKRNLHQVISVWPEFSSLTEINPKKIAKETLDALQKLYDTVCRKHKEVDSLQREKHKLNDYIGGLQVKSERHIDELRKKDNEIGDLDHKVGLLEGELRKRGIAPKVMVPEEPRGDYDDDIAEGSHFNRRSEKRLSMTPTPFLQAGGQRGQDAAIKRSSSMLTDGRRTGVKVMPTDSTSMVEELNAKMRNLQFQLESTKRENQELRDRLETRLDTSGSLSKLAPSAGPTIQTLTELYRDLEERALDRVTASLTRILVDKTEGAIHQFLCFTMETAYLKATTLMKGFIDTVHSLLINPLNRDAPSVTDLENKRESYGHINKKMFEKSPDLHAMSRLARRTRLTTELPKYLEEEVASFIRVTSDSTNIETLISEVEDILRRTFPSYATEAVLNDTTFSDFLNGCCRLSWQGCAMSPPCHIFIDNTRRRYDEYYHEVLTSQRYSKVAIGAEIEYFIWPMLCRKKNGEVLYRARVALSKGAGARF